MWFLCGLRWKIHRHMPHLLVGCDVLIQSDIAKCWQAQNLVVLITIKLNLDIPYIPRNMHTVFALLCFVVVIHWLTFPYPSGLLHWHCGNLTIAPVPAKQPWWIWINTSCEFIMNDCITTTKQSTTKPCAYFLGYTVCEAKSLSSLVTPWTHRNDTIFIDLSCGVKPPRQNY